MAGFPIVEKQLKLNSYLFRNNDYLWLVVVGEEQYVYFIIKGDNNSGSFPPAPTDSAYGQKYTKY